MYNAFSGESSTRNAVSTVELSIVMPCLNEAETLETCIKKAQWYLEQHQVSGEVIIADNGSTDGSQEIARSLGARVIDIPQRGYGSALRGGIEAARGEYVIMGDADDSYDFTRLTPFLAKLREGYDLVMGNRFRGGIKPGAMPRLHRFLGNPVLTWVGRVLFASPCGDFHCGLRGFRTRSIQELALQTTGMEFASEMVVKATLYRLRMTEVPTTLSPDGRSRPPHLRSWRDGWRHLRFLLLYSPRWLFLYPGILLMLMGVLLSAWLLPETRGIFDVHTLLYAATAVIVGFQVTAFAVFSKLFAIREGLLPPDQRLLRVLRHISLESGLMLGSVLLTVGVGGTIYALNVWSGTSFGELNPSIVMRLVIPSVTALALGVQVIFSSFFLSILEL
ncbi:MULTISPECIES: glycosyltransferase family 2 protein [Leptolyngbya]|uniref:glycosyltransferase family 2 protein n=1 Tax=Leptolyngbya TaxID=47251 RepID=UPI0018EFC7B6|nr:MULTISPECIES: glycosyltransferase family 2 protein [unclassified Leptolyngbya]MBN8563389.1 glycosyltransferase family 2 protein [Leptolyngbya sp. UWPOB_LEPTO1]MCY6493566.1 glycosyltransferase family 2 protein [Leptolyngbya sp. GGD]